jgi:hypothetical protein
MTFQQTVWVKNSREATGQDQLGLRFFSETIYQDLLPNITNVTSRGRYYSFYPWFIWSIENRAEKFKEFSLQQLIRRADCLLTLIGLYHHQITENTKQSFHDGLVGAKKLGTVLNEMLESGEMAQISKYAAEVESPDRYFKNKFGGLGQYYFGPLRDAGILAYNQKGEIHYTEDRGLVIAEAFDESVAGEDFLEVLENDWVSADDLENLLDFCPCRLSENPAEQNALIDFFFSRKEVFQNHLWEKRKKSLMLILDFIQKSNIFDLKIPLDSSGIHNFLSAAYTGAFNENLLWDDTVQSSETKLLWQQYYAGELLSFAVQGLFWAGLTKLSEDEELVSNCQDYGDWFAEKFASSIEEFSNKLFTEVIEEIELNLPEIVNWKNENHEIYLTRQLEQIVRDKRLPNRQEKMVSLAIGILLSLAARWEGENNKINFPVTFSNQQLSEYPINLTNFLYFCKNDWREMKLKEWLAWLACKWGVETHLMIALRKFQQEALDTFKIFPSEEGLQVKDVIGDKTIEEVLLPGFTSPRLRTTLQILLDLGVIAVEKDLLLLTPTGETLLEELACG